MEAKCIVPSLTVSDPELTEKIVKNIKSQGMFDQFRRDCLADVDTKPSYQNLRQRVEGYVSKFLTTQKWDPTLNKNQLRDELRRQINATEMLSMGVEHVVDQIVSLKATRVFLPQIEIAMRQYLGLEELDKKNKAPEDKEEIVQDSTQIKNECKPTENTNNVSLAEIQLPREDVGIVKNKDCDKQINTTEEKDIVMKDDEDARDCPSPPTVELDPPPPGVEVEEKACVTFSNIETFDDSRNEDTRSSCYTDTLVINELQPSPSESSKDSIVQIKEISVFTITSESSEANVDKIEFKKDFNDSSDLSSGVEKEKKTLCESALLKQNVKEEKWEKPKINIEKFNFDMERKFETLFKSTADEGKNVKIEDKVIKIEAKTGKQEIIKGEDKVIKIEAKTGKQEIIKGEDKVIKSDSKSKILNIKKTKDSSKTEESKHSSSKSHTKSSVSAHDKYKKMDSKTSSSGSHSSSHSKHKSSSKSRDFNSDKPNKKLSDRSSEKLKSSSSHKSSSHKHSSSSSSKSVTVKGHSSSSSSSSSSSKSSNKQDDKIMGSKLEDNKSSSKSEGHKSSGKLDDKGNRKEEEKTKKPENRAIDISKPMLHDSKSKSKGSPSSIHKSSHCKTDKASKSSLDNKHKILSKYANIPSKNSSEKTKKCDEKPVERILFPENRTADCRKFTQETSKHKISEISATITRETVDDEDQQNRIDNLKTTTNTDRPQTPRHDKQEFTFETPETPSERSRSQEKKVLTDFESSETDDDFMRSLAKAQGDQDDEGQKSDVTVSSVHTSDLSSFDDEISLSSNDELPAADVVVTPKGTKDAKKLPLKNVKEIAATILKEKTNSSGRSTPVMPSGDEETNHSIPSSKANTEITKEECAKEESSVVVLEVHTDDDELLRSGTRSGLRRQRKINPKYMSEEYSSIFNKRSHRKSTEETKTAVKRTFNKTQERRSSKGDNNEDASNKRYKAEVISSEEHSTEENNNLSKRNKRRSGTRAGSPDCGKRAEHQRYESSDLYRPHASCKTRRFT